MKVIQVIKLLLVYDPGPHRGLQSSEPGCGNLHRHPSLQMISLERSPAGKKVRCKTRDPRHKTEDAKPTMRNPNPSCWVTYLTQVASLLQSYLPSDVFIPDTGQGRITAFINSDSIMAIPVASPSPVSAKASHEEAPSLHPTYMHLTSTTTPWYLNRLSFLPGERQARQTIASVLALRDDRVPGSPNPEITRDSPRNWSPTPFPPGSRLHWLPTYEARFVFFVVAHAVFICP